MPSNTKRNERARAVSTIGRQAAPTDGMVNIGPALVQSHITRLHGLPYPVQFREQGAIEAWTHALGGTELWRCWRNPGMPCWGIRWEVLRLLESMSSSHTVFGQLGTGDRQRIAFEASTNLKYHLSQGGGDRGHGGAGNATSEFGRGSRSADEHGRAALRRSVSALRQNGHAVFEGAEPAVARPRLRRSFLFPDPAGRVG